MPKLTLEPTPMPFDMSDEEPNTFHDEVAVAANTADFLTSACGAPLEVDLETLRAEKRLLEKALATQDTNALTSSLGAAYAAKSFLQSYGKVMGFDAGQARAAITAKLMEIANCGETRFELKALELLGKHSDIGLFTERSEITIKHKDADSLEEAIKARVKTLLLQKLPSAPVTVDELDDELGVLSPSADGSYELIDTPLDADLDVVLGVAPEPSEEELANIDRYYASLEANEARTISAITGKPRV